MSRRILAYECQYCGCVKKTKNICIRHEAACKHNPEARNCQFCVHSERLEQRVKGGGSLWCPVKQMACSSAISASCQHFISRSKEDNNGKV